MQAQKSSGNDTVEFSVRVSIPKVLLVTLGATVLFVPSASPEQVSGCELQ